ncbi:hypothetical protein PLICRDRAFT_103663 [Plicaturopsis crispa FD-325 SS-3]|nr:hypothetical protein PLICRDRAFT_103663 [Plicaturopsis crispa FD-325 SS-3]
MATSASDELLLLESAKKHVSKGIARANEGILTGGSGAYLNYIDGTRVLDFTCGIAVTNLGQTHPKVTAAIKEQAGKGIHLQIGGGYNEPQLRLINKLVPVMPHPSLDRIFLATTGGEAIENALKMARIFTGRQNIIGMQGGYHGRTYGAMAVTKSKTIYSAGFGPLMPGVFAIPFPYWHQLGLPRSASEEEVTQKSLYQLDLVLSQQSAPSDTAAILVEPILGEGGYVPAPAAFLHGLRAVCDKHGIMLIIDEVQTGFGRTGRMFFTEESGVRPDILAIAKGIANGMPLSAVACNSELNDLLPSGSLGGTYAGNVLSCAAGAAVLDIIREEHILDNVNARSAELFAALAKLRENPVVGPHILDVRGRGLMVGIEFASPSGSEYDSAILPSAPKGLASRVAKRCHEKGLDILTTSVYEVIRFIPSLTITQEEMSAGMAIFAEAVEEVVREG